MRLLLIPILLLFVVPGLAQELNCRVKVQAPQVQGSQMKDIFNSFQQDVRAFMNERKWTGLDYAIEERIDCNIIITISEAPSQDHFKGSIQIQSSRPVYNSSYNTTILNYKDDAFDVNYLQNTSLRFSIDQHRTNLTSILAFYAYMIIGMDHDSFEKEGGDPFFQKAKQIVSNAQNSNRDGWKGHESKTNRYWLVENTLHDVFQPLRLCMYEYHRKGLDLMYEKPKEGRDNITQGLMKLQEVHTKRPSSFNMQLFFTAKADEIVKIYKEAPPRQQNKVVNLLRKIDPSNINKYNSIKGGG